MRGHQPLGLVIEEQPRALARRQLLAVDGDHIIGGDVERRRIDEAAVDRDTALRNHFLGVAARSKAGARQNLGDALASLLRLRLRVRTVLEVRTLAISTAAAESGTLGKNLAVILVVAARTVLETIAAAVAARMLLPVHATFVSRAAIVTIFPGAVEFWPLTELPLAALAILTRTREARTLVSATAVVALLPWLVVASVSALEFAIAIPIPELPVLKTAGGTRFVAVAARRPIVARRSRAIRAITTWPVAILAETFAARPVRALVAITVSRRIRLLVAELPVGKASSRAGPVAIAAWGVGALVPIAVSRVALAIPVARLERPLVAVTVEVGAVAARLEGPLLALAVARGAVTERPVAAGAVIAAEARLVAIRLAPLRSKAALGELLVGPPRLAGAALAARRSITSAAGGVVFVVFAG